MLKDDVRILWTHTHTRTRACAHAACWCVHEQGTESLLTSGESRCVAVSFTAKTPRRRLRTIKNKKLNLKTGKCVNILWFLLETVSSSFPPPVSSKVFQIFDPNLLKSFLKTWMWPSPGRIWGMSFLLFKNNLFNWFLLWTKKIKK